MASSLSENTQWLASERKREIRERAIDIFNLYVAEGQSLQEIGDKYGITRERVRQIVATKWKHRPVAELRAIVKNTVAERLSKESAKTCVCCLRPHHRGTRTCSSRCSELWTITRYRRDDEYRLKHRVYKAKSVVKNRDHYSPEQVRHSEAVLAGTAKSYNPPRFSRFSNVEAAMITIEGLRGVID